MNFPWYYHSPHPLATQALCFPKHTQTVHGVCQCQAPSNCLGNLLHYLLASHIQRMAPIALIESELLTRGKAFDKDHFTRAIITHRNGILLPFIIVDSMTRYERRKAKRRRDARPLYTPAYFKERKKRETEAGTGEK